MTTFPFGHVYKAELGDKKFAGHPSAKGDVLIGNDVWIGSSVTIMSGVKIGDGAVLSANACVVKDFPPYHIVAGNPGCSIKKRFDDEIIELLLESKWWDFSTTTIKNISERLCSRPDKNLLSELISLHHQ